MKREHFQLNPQPGQSSMAGKSKLWEDGSQRDGGVDELLAVLGYEVRSSDMVDVAQKLEQLEEFMGNVQGDGLSHLASETVHYNPSDLSTWLESMIYELNPSPPFDSVVGPPAKTPLDGSFLPPDGSFNVTSIDFAEQRNQRLFEESSNSDYDLKAIPGKAICNRNTQFQETWSREKKRLKPSTELESESEQFSDSLTRPVVLVDSQENGIQLVHTLMACAEAVHQNSLNLAEALLKRVGYLAVSQTGAMRKVATYFAEALARRIYRLYPQNARDHSFSDSLQSHFYESCPYLKFAHFTANQALLEAFEGKKRVHVIDFSMNEGMQWPALLQVLALRPGGPPAFRLTGIGPPARDNSDYLQEVGWKLAQLAKMIHVKFEYRGFVTNSLTDLDLSMLELRPSEDESVAVNSVFELHKLLARPGAIGKVLSVVKQMKPSIVTVVEQEASHNGPNFLDRFTESLHYYSTLFDSLEGSVTANNQDKAMTEMYLGKQICNVVACEGADRVERHENLTQWRTRFQSAGFDSAPLGSNAFKQASILLALFVSGDGYGVEERNGCMMLGWHSRPLITTSAWKVAGRERNIDSVSRLSSSFKSKVGDGG